MTTRSRSTDSSTDSSTGPDLSESLKGAAGAVAAERLDSGLNTLCWPQNAGRVQVGLKVTNELSISRFAALVYEFTPRGCCRVHGAEKQGAEAGLVTTTSPMVPTVNNPELLTAEELIEAVAHLITTSSPVGLAHENADERQEAHENADERQEAVPVAQENADEGALTSAQGEAQPSGVQSE